MVQATADQDENLSLNWERIDPGTIVLRLRGELELDTAARFQRWAAEVIRHGARRVVVDLSGVTFVDSAGITGLVSLWKRSTATAALCIAGPNRRCLEALHTAQVGRLMAVYQTVEVALAETKVSPR
jgi:anti-anti-sigma factor